MRSIHLPATGLLLQLAFTTTLALPDHAQWPKIITRDVAIIGGGSTGTYAAFKLLDQGHTVVVVEAKGRLGGHTETFHDSLLAAPVEMGVVVFHDLDLVRNYFARFNVALTNINLFASGNASYVNFAAGQLAKSYIPPTPQALSAAMKAYGALLSKYAYVQEGFNLPNPVPEELVIPFGEFVEKHSLQAIVYTIFKISQGLGDILNVPTIYVMQNFGLGVVNDPFLTTARGDNSQIYERATAELEAKNSVLLNTYVTSADRNKRDKEGYLSIIVKTGNPSRCTVIRAKQILITIPPTLEKLAPFNLDTTEKSIFGKFKWVAYITGILKNTGLPPGIAFENANPANKYGLPKLPALYGLYDTAVPGLTGVKYVSTSSVSENAAKKDIFDTVARLKHNGIINSTKEKPEFVAYSDHSPFEMKVDRADIEGGFYERMYGLQGKRGTWWTGAAWFTQDSSLLWKFTEGVLARLVKEL